MTMRTPDEVVPRLTTEVNLLRFGLREIARLAPGGHLSDPCYGARREIKEYALDILARADGVRQADDTTEHAV